MGIYHYWDMLQSNGTYLSEAVLANGCYYEPTRGLKTASSFWVKNPNIPSQFVSERAESFGYDASLDYLTVANYNDGLPGSSQSWSYNAAGNRNDSVCDNLNRATSIGGVSCTNDILGNRLTKGASTYTWDILNRMVSFGQTEYRYRADGMRVQKISGSNATRYRYDGQMGIEDVSGSVVTRYGLGARGVDFIEQSTGTGTATVFPIYDAHGNNVASLSRDGMGYQVSNRRSFDAWGNVRLGAQTGDPTGRYCANLGHKQDDESGLIYMRARYYEPGSGRFVSEDPAMDGVNWFIYCGNEPVNCFDIDGKFTYFDFQMMNGFMSLFLAATISMKWGGIAMTKFEKAAVSGLLILSAFAFGEAIGETEHSQNRLLKFVANAAAYSGVFAVLAEGLGKGRLARGFTQAAIYLSTTYSLIVLGLILGSSED